MTQSLVPALAISSMRFTTASGVGTQITSFPACPISGLNSSTPFGACCAWAQAADAAKARASTAR